MRVGIREWVYESRVYEASRVHGGEYMRIRIWE